jgi:glycosyltransferase involved in cell wall biosynthesis
MKILYVSTLCSQNVIDIIFETAIKKPEQPAQKFHSLIAKGIGLYPNKAEIRTLSVIPVIPSTHKKKIWNLKNEFFDGVTYSYIPMLNFRVVKNAGVFIYTFFKVLFWSMLKQRKSTVVICDYLNVSITLASFLACKVTKTKIVAIATDIPGMMITTNKGNEKSIFRSIYKTINNNILYRFNGYIILTKYMNHKINPKNKPSMVMEGLVDAEMKSSKNDLAHKAKERIIIYAGGLYEKYGIKTLIEAFMMLSYDDIRLHLYGAGPMVNEIVLYAEKDSRIEFKGMIPNKIVVEDQLKATLLVNPRPTTEEFTKYSFPSKNMEYMVSGTTMITTPLPGMPPEYADYVKLFEDETVAGMCKTLNNVLKCNREELHEFGIKAKKFVLENKNNKYQANRILEFVQSF